MSSPRTAAADGAASGSRTSPDAAIAVPATGAREIRKAFVTGASGFVGANLARTLIAQGIAPVAFLRPGSDRSSLRGLDLEVIEGDLLDAACLERALRSCEACFHLAAALSSDDPAELQRVNVEGSRAVLGAALA